MEIDLGDVRSRRGLLLATSAVYLSAMFAVRPLMDDADGLLHTSLAMDAGPLEAVESKHMIATLPIRIWRWGRHLQATG